jgi:Formyl transferase
VTVILLAGPGDASHIVFHHLAARVGPVHAVVEDPVSRWTLATRRARRVGWVEVAGQMAFVGGAMPVLRLLGRDRIDAICRAGDLDRSPIGGAHPVPSVNDPATAALVRRLEPDVVVVNGTRIISKATLDAIDAPVVNMHAGVTPRYRGVHGGYWALAEGRPEEVGTTVHLVDPGIDTGGVLGRATFEPGPGDSIATYPYLHLAAGLPVLDDVVSRLLAGQPVGELDPLPGADSRLRYHPALWSYLVRRIRSGVR